MNWLLDGYPTNDVYIYCTDSCPGTSISSDACDNIGWKGDSYCDDGNNHCGCEWDGGDCCGSNVNTQRCSACECLDPNANSGADTSTTSTTTSTIIGCIYPSFQFQQKIVGGVSAVSPIPWQVSVFIGTWICGGTILDEITILSAASCFSNPDSPSTIRAGSLKTYEGGQVSYLILKCWPM